MRETLVAEETVWGRDFRCERASKGGGAYAWSSYTTYMDETLTASTEESFQESVFVPCRTWRTSLWTAPRAVWNTSLKSRALKKKVKTTEIWQLWTALQMSWNLAHCCPVVIRANTTEPVSTPPGDPQTAKSLWRTTAGNRLSEERTERFLTILAVTAESLITKWTTVLPAWGSKVSTITTKQDVKHAGREKIICQLNG